MEIYGTSLVDLIRQSVREPRAAARHIFALPFASTILWQALLLVVVLSVLLFQVTVVLSGPSPATQSDLMPGMVTSPFMLGLVQGSLLVMMVFAIHWVGRTFGGTGRFEGAIALVAWLQFLLICLQIVQILAMVLLPPLSGVIAVLGFVVFFWLLTQFLCELHGFESPGLVFVMILVTMLALTFALSILLGIVGLLFLGEIPNV